MSIFKRTLEALLVLALATSVNCSKKDSTPENPQGNQTSSVVSESLDETLKEAQTQIKGNQYQDAITILEGYSSEKKEIQATKHVLLADAYLGQLKNELERDGSYYTTDHSLLIKFSQKIKTNLSAAGKLDPQYKDKKWDYFLRVDGQIQKCEDTSSPLNTVKSLLYAGSKKDVSAMNRIAAQAFEKICDDDLFRYMKKPGADASERYHQKWQERIELKRKRLQDGTYHFDTVLASNPEIDLFLVDVQGNQVKIALQINKKDFGRFTCQLEKKDNRYRILEFE